MCFCEPAYAIGVDVCLLQVEIHYFSTNRTRDMTLMKSQKSIFFVFR